MIEKFEKNMGREGYEKKGNVVFRTETEHETKTDRDRQTDRQIDKERDSDRNRRRMNCGVIECDYLTTRTLPISFPCLFIASHHYEN